MFPIRYSFSQPAVLGLIIDELTGEITLEGSAEKSPFDFESVKKHKISVSNCSLIKGEGLVLAL